MKKADSVIHGGVAQLGEHLLCKQRVAGSSPVTSTKVLGVSMVARNDITGDAIQTKTASQSYRDNYDNIFRKGKVDGKEQSQQPNADQDGQTTSGTIESNTAEGNA